MKSLKCIKCDNESIEVIKDYFHASAGGNISRPSFYMSKEKAALVTFYICDQCGYIEHYLDKNELEKIVMNKQEP